LASLFLVALSGFLFSARSQLLLDLVPSFFLGALAGFFFRTKARFFLGSLAGYRFRFLAHDFGHRSLARKFLRCMSQCFSFYAETRFLFGTTPSFFFGFCSRLLLNL